MKFGIFYELQLPRPWQAGDELKLYQDALTQLETADRLGYDYAWVVEHHFLEEYSHSPSPESFLAAASQRTKNIRLGHGIFQHALLFQAQVAPRLLLQNRHQVDGVPRQVEIAFGLLVVAAEVHQAKLHLALRTQGEHDEGE